MPLLLIDAAWMLGSRPRMTERGVGGSSHSPYRRLYQEPVRQLERDDFRWNRNWD